MSTEMRKDYLSVLVFLPDDVPDLDLLIITNVHIYEEICKEFSGRGMETMSLEALMKNAMVSNQCD